MGWGFVAGRAMAFDGGLGLLRSVKGKPTQFPCKGCMVTLRMRSKVVSLM